MSAAGRTTVRPATRADRPVIDRLMQFCLYDAAAEAPFPIGDDGRYAYDLLDAFWHAPYLIRVDAELAGMALVVPDCPVTGRSDCRFMAEFLVLRPWRRQGVGRAAASAIMTRHPGPWHIAVHDGNPGAMAFWLNAIPVTVATPRRARFDGMALTVLPFDIGA